MDYRVVEKRNKKYVECLPGIRRIENEQDAIDLIAACGENEVNLLMLHAENFTPDFYKLRTGIAGDILQKFVTYGIRVAAVLTPELVNQGKFQEMVIEANRGRQFHVFYEREKAEAWLIEG